MDKLILGAHNQIGLYKAYILVDFGVPSGVDNNWGVDTTYDDMLISRIVTSAANVATITNLVNKIDLSIVGDSPDITPTSYQDNTSILTMTAIPSSTAIINVNWSRTPVSTFNGAADLQVQFTTGGIQDAEMNIGVRTESRYQIACLYERTNNPTSTKIGYSARA